MVLSAQYGLPDMRPGIGKNFDIIFPKKRKSSEAHAFLMYSYPPPPFKGYDGFHILRINRVGNVRPRSEIIWAQGSVSEPKRLFPDQAPDPTFQIIADLAPNPAPGPAPDPTLSISQYGTKSNF